MNKKRTNRIARCILIGLLFQLYPIKEVKCEPATVSATAVLTAYLPVIASYVSGILSVYLAQTQHWSKGMHSIAQEMERRCPSVVTDIQNKRAATPPQAATKATSSMLAQQSEQRVATQADIKTVSQQDVQRFRTGLRKASAALSASLGQRMHDHLSNMSKPSNFELRNVPGGIRITHLSSGLSFQAALDPPVDRSMQHVLDVDAIIAQLPQGYADALRVCKHIDEGNIEAAAEIARLSTSQEVKTQYEKRIDYLFASWQQDPLVRSLPERTKLKLMGSSRHLAEFFDCVLARDLIHSSLCKAWDIKCNAHQVVKNAVYALCDANKEGQLYFMPELINQRLDEIISKASGKDRDALVEAFYLPNGVSKDFADHTVVKALKMPKAILGDEYIEQRRMLNDLVVGYITAATKDQQQITLRAMSNVKFACSYPMSAKMKGVLFDSADLVCKSLKQDVHELADKFMVEVKHFKDLQTPLQFFVQSEVGDAKNALLDVEIECIARKKIEQAVCYERQLEGLEHSVALVQKELPEHALQLCYKILVTDPKKFAKRLPEFTTVVQERKDTWVQRDMQGNILKVSNGAIKNDGYRAIKKYLNAAQKEFEQLPESAVLNNISSQEIGEKSSILLPNDDTPKGCGPPLEDKQLHVNTPGFGGDELKIKTEPCIQPVLDEDQKAQLYHAQDKAANSTTTSSKHAYKGKESKEGQAKKEHPHGIYEDAPYHTAKGNKVKSKRPKDGQKALDNSVPVPNNDKTNKKERRIGVSEGEFVVIDRTCPGQYHGHVREWQDLRPEMQKALRDAGYVNKKGKIL